jgi:hypothetical protein
MLKGLLHEFVFWLECYCIRPRACELPGEENFKVTTKPFHKLIVGVHVEEQTFDNNGGDMVADENDDKLGLKDQQQRAGGLQRAPGKKAIMQTPDTHPSQRRRGLA